MLNHFIIAITKFECNGRALAFFLPYSFLVLSRAVPSAVFSQPPIGQVGLTEEQVSKWIWMTDKVTISCDTWHGIILQAIKEYGDVDVYTANFRPLKATLSGLPDRIFMKLIACAKTDKVLGLHICGEDSPEIIQVASSRLIFPWNDLHVIWHIRILDIQGFAVAVKAGLTKADFDATVGIHPTAAEELVTMRTPTRKLRRTPSEVSPLLRAFFTYYYFFRWRELWFLK